MPIIPTINSKNKIGTNHITCFNIEKLEKKLKNDWWRKREREREREIEIEIELDRKYFTFKNEGLLMMCQNMLKCVCYYERLFYECIRVYILNIKLK